MSNWNNQSRFLPFQVQAERLVGWVAISNHHTEETANRRQGRLKRDIGGTFRVVAAGDSRFIR